MTEAFTRPLLATIQSVHQASRTTGQLSTEAKNHALEAIAQALETFAPEILAANQQDCEQAQAEGLPNALIARLKLDANKLQGAITGVRQVAGLADPVGEVQIKRELDTGLILQRLTCPLGVLGVIFEARPDAVIQISSLAVKSGNGVVLKGGKEAIHSCQAIVKAIHQGLAQSDYPAAALALLTQRSEIQQLLELDQWVDLIIPRGSNEFVRYIQDHTRIPVLGHADGICHLYIDQAADLAQAVAITVDSKTQYPAACNAIETLLVHAEIAPKFLPMVCDALQAKGVELRGDATSCQFVELVPATATDWATEYCDLIVSIKVVDSLDAALEHIDTYGSGHTEAIVTQDQETARKFLAQVDAAGVFHNCSTRFADGFRYGLGAEVGISTAKLPPRGPVGLEGLITYKYQLVGDGHIVQDYSGPRAKAFTHQDLT
ncbi:glutamate-5-semialdehyde dehydrogenase [Thermosynechococcaceae cyanobacterium BACA0444]|uniref:Gamma-glutamyl phosphate reductase n=1 Tax=Pseudocalidococcus azoricus BACA0444 TaxID=2918990 RepID=A0AAE4JX55_9CYAN|nr:glutamate-5-semialdehyde dehydrogenase [Pseudocalidococcus azoricus]MDS3862155.1 glutamate-5-semialdehyde dehydrogenase [Pseudocalidococcus azoricus BACA0444]